MRLLKEQNLPIRPHYFWPLLTQPLKEKNIAGMNKDLRTVAETIQFLLLIEIIKTDCICSSKLTFKMGTHQILYVFLPEL